MCQVRQRCTACQVRQRCTACLQATDAIGKMIRVAVEPAIGTMSDDPLPKVAVFFFYTFITAITVLGRHFTHY